MINYKKYYYLTLTNVFISKHFASIWIEFKGNKLSTPAFTFLIADFSDTSWGIIPVIGARNAFSTFADVNALVSRYPIFSDWIIFYFNLNFYY